MTTALVTHLDCLGHDMGHGHPECPARLRAVLAALEQEMFAPLLREQAPMATVEQIARVHPESYVKAILAIRPEPGDLLQLDGDTSMSAGSADAALRAAGGAVLAADLVISGAVRTAFAAVRPPGHHAEALRPMGFCLFNNAAVAAFHARAVWGLKRVAVLDFDVHHGNGTQSIFAEQPGLFYGSSHQDPCYPGTGHAWERGAADNILNVGLKPGSGSAEFRAAWTDVLLPALDRFEPEFVIISAGFDAHKADPLAELRLETADYGWITDRLIDVADRHASGHLMSVLEGGYDLQALAAASAVHVRSLMRVG
jgi:acetoin utilization deacetylase AcuC-like enzyme